MLPPADLVHEKTDTIRKGSANRVHFACSNPKCKKEPIRKDKWDTHVLQATSDLHLQEAPGDVLERSQNFAPDGEWDTKEARMQRVVTFMEQRHYLALARMHGEADLAKKVTDANRFFIRLTNMVRSMDPTTKILLKHYEEHYKSGNMGDLANLIFNIVWLRNSMSKEVVKMVEEERMPWMHLDTGKVADESKKAMDEVFLALDGHIFFGSVQPMKSRSKFPRKGYGEFVSELVSFARVARNLAELWMGDAAVVNLAAKIRTVYGFGGKGFRMKEIVLDLAEVTKDECPAIAQQLVDFGVVGPGPRRTLNFVFNRRFR